MVLYHFQLGAQSGFLGVDIFFVISGFVITRQLSKSLDNGSFRFWGFYKRRFQRLFLPIAFVLLTTLLTSFFILGHRAFVVTTQTALGSIFGLSNLVIHRETGDYFAPTPEANPLLHTWSLSVEEQFYFFLPILLFALARITGSKWVSRALFALVSISIFSVATWISQEYFVNVPRFDLIFSFYSPIVRLWEFAAGAIVFLAQGSKIADRLRISRSFAWILLTILLSITQLPAHTIPLQKESLTILAVALSSLIIASDVNGQFGNSLLESKFFVWIGDRSYSIYLWHWPVYVLVGVVSNWNWNPALLFFVLAATLLLASLTFRFVENGLGKVLMNKHFKISAPSVVSGAVITAFALSALYPQAFPDAVSQEENRKIDYFSLAPGCGVERWCINYSSAEGKSIKERPVYLVGDSNAQMFYPGLLEASRLAERDLVFRTQSSCPPVRADFTVNLETCLSYKRDVLEFLASSPPGLVVLGLTNVYLKESSDPVGFFSDFSDSIADFATDVEKFGHSFVLIEPIPQFEWTDKSFGAELLSREAAGKDLSLQIDDGLQSQAFEREFEGLQRKVDVFPTWSTLCPNGSCQVIANGKFVWRDSNHLTAEASYKFTEDWARVLSPKK